MPKKPEAALTASATAAVARHILRSTGRHSTAIAFFGFSIRNTDDDHEDAEQKDQAVPFHRLAQAGAVEGAERGEDGCAAPPDVTLIAWLRSS